MCVGTYYIKDPVNTFKDYNMPKYLDGDEAKYVPKKERLELALIRYMERE